MEQNKKNNIYAMKKQKEHILVASVLGGVIVIIIFVVICLAGKDSQTYYIGPIVPWESETETESETENETEIETDTQTDSETEISGQLQENNGMQPSNQAGTIPDESENLPEGLYCWNHHYYSFYDGVNSWDEAVAFCEEKGGYMASITSSEENDTVYGFMLEDGIKNAYFGWYLNAETSTWEWVNGEAGEYKNWNPGEPNGERGKEKYGMFYYKYKNGAWNDGDFGLGTANGGTMFICEWDSYPQNF